MAHIRRDEVLPRAAAHEIRGRRRAPDVGRRTRLPDFRALRTVAMPGARLEVAQLLILHLVELAEQLDHLIIRLAIIDRDVMARPMADRAPDDVDLVPGEHVAGIL